MKKWKLITLIISVIVLIGVSIALVLIFTYKKDTNESTYHYPTVTPTISNKDETFMTLGSRNITNEEMYNMTIVTYGLSTMNEMIDSKLLDLNVTD